MRGCVIDGLSRDTEFMIEMGFQAFFKAYTPRDIVGAWLPKAVDEPIKIGDVWIRPGDYILGDRDGVVRIPVEVIEEVLEKGRGRDLDREPGPHRDPVRRRSAKGLSGIREVLMAHDPRLILLDPRDNVFVARMRLAAGDIVEIGAGRARLDCDIPLAHKVARQAIAPGETIVKYGAPIGVATQAIAAGSPCPRPQHEERLHADLPSRGRAQGGDRVMTMEASTSHTFSPHPEEAASASVSKDAPARSGASFETQASLAPQDEGSLERASLRGYPRSDGRKGIRNVVAVAYLVECAHHVAREIALPWREDDVHVIGFPGCYPNGYAEKMLERLCTHPNVGAVLLVSLGCESFNKYALERAVAASGRPVRTIIIQGAGGTRTSIAQGRVWVEEQRLALDEQETVPMAVSELIVGTVCGGSDGTSGITGNPAAGTRLRPAYRRGRRLHLRGDRRTDRLRAHHGGPRGDA